MPCLVNHHRRGSLLVAALIRDLHPHLWQVPLLGPTCLLSNVSGPSGNPSGHSVGAITSRSDSVCEVYATLIEQYSEFAGQSSKTEIQVFCRMCRVPRYNLCQELRCDQPVVERVRDRVSQARMRVAARHHGQISIKK